LEIKIKYKNKITISSDGIKFHSKKECHRYEQLKLLQKSGYITNLQCQPKIPLIVNRKNIGNYIGDFKYFDLKSKKYILEDVKSPITKTPLYNLKKKILLTYNPPIEITEII
tara:strand:+ start:400 stop:735 length:336 start_codon:yes stop_codon:yes gene_type:complete